MDRVAQKTLSPFMEKELIKLVKAKIGDPLDETAQAIVSQGYNVKSNFAQHINDNIYSIQLTIKITPKKKANA